MPMLTDPPGDWVDPDTVPRPVITFGVAMDAAGDLQMGAHHHAKGQILLALRGVLSCEVERGLWMVPPHSAIWISGGEIHAIRASGKIHGYNAFISAADASRLPAKCCTISVAPLLRELLIRSANFPVLYPDDGLEAHLMTLLIDEVAIAPIGKLHLPMPVDQRLREIIETMMVDPASRAGIKSWAARFGFSERTFARRLTQETRMSFNLWRRRINVMLALQMLAEGKSIQQVAASLGYESASSFVTQFRKVLGAPPGRYMAERHAGSGLGRRQDQRLTVAPPIFTISGSEPQSCAANRTPHACALQLRGAGRRGGSAASQ
jgi:AraC-like DNA-binding protein